MNEIPEQVKLLRNLKDAGCDEAMMQKYLKLEKEGASFEELELMTLGTLRKAVVEGDVTRGTVMAGQSAGLVKQEQTCSEMIEEIMDQAKKLLKEA